MTAPIRPPALALIDECPTGTCDRQDCRHHLPGEGRASCVLDMADEPRTLDFIAQLFGLTRERVRQVELAALAKCRAAGIDLEAAVRKRETHWERLESESPGCFGTTRHWKGRTGWQP